MSTPIERFGGDRHLWSARHRCWHGWPGSGEQAGFGRVAGGDELPWGGTCALRGCDPRKILRPGAEVIDSARLMRGKGIEDRGPSINGADLTRHRHGFTDPVPQRMGGPVSKRCREPSRDGHLRDREPSGRRRACLWVEALLDRDGCPSPPAGLSPSGAPARQHRIPRPRAGSWAGAVLRRRVRLVRVRPHCHPGWSQPGHRRPREPPARALRPPPRRPVGGAWGRGGLDVRAETTVSSVEHVGSACRVTVDTAGIEVVIEIELVGSAHRRRAATAGSALRRPAREAG